MSRHTHAFTTSECLEARWMLTGSPYVDRGWVSVIVDHTIAADLAPKIEQFKRDLVADGWTVAPDSTDSQILGHAQAPRMDDEKYVWNNNDAQEPVTLQFDEEFHNLDQYKLDLQAVKDIVEADRQAAIDADSQLAQIVLIGHVTVPYSGAPTTEGDAYNQHEASAATSDLYYADFDGSPATWGDYRLLAPAPLTITPHNLHFENTTNEIGDGRFDTMFVPPNVNVVTVTGNSGSFQLHYSDVNSEDEEDTHEFDTVTLPAGASADAVREALNDQLALLGSGSAFATVIKDGDTYNIRLLDSTGETAEYVKSLTVSGSGLSTASTTMETGGAECAIGRIDMANLDSAFPLIGDDDQPMTNAQIERTLLKGYFEKDHKWRTGQVDASDAFIDETSEDTLTVGAK